VTWFWGVYRGRNPAKDLTDVAHNGAAPFSFGSVGEPLYVGYPEPFREINIQLSAGCHPGWMARLEYSRKGDESRSRSKWGALTERTNSTNRLKRSGQITFNPPRDWRPISINGKTRLFYIRFRTINAGGRPPVARTLLGRDYVAANGTETGTVPVFDNSADANQDGYLDDAEYARRAPGKDARFVYESRMLTDQYGQMRFSTNPHDAGFRKWAVNFHLRLLKRYPHASGFFMDNCNGRPPVASGAVRESVATYAEDYGRLLQAIDRAIRPRWMLANTELHPRADPVVQHNPAYMEEFAIRPLAHNYVQFEDLAQAIARRARLVSPPPLAVIDSYPQGSSPTNPRMQLSTLAYYYLLADPKNTFLMLYGGFEPASPWNRHWIPAAAYNIGKPLGAWSVWKSGVDPANNTLTYRIYQRRFRKALVLYKPLSHDQRYVAKPSLGKETITRHELGRSYRALKADGKLGRRRTRIALRNGQGAILVRSP
jgi:hypothetical protein